MRPVICQHSSVWGPFILCFLMSFLLLIKRNRYWWGENEPIEAVLSSDSAESKCEGVCQSPGKGLHCVSGDPERRDFWKWCGKKGRQEGQLPYGGLPVPLLYWNPRKWLGCLFSLFHSFSLKQKKGNTGMTILLNTVGKKKINPTIFSKPPEFKYIPF